MDEPADPDRGRGLAPGHGAGDLHEFFDRAMPGPLHEPLAAQLRGGPPRDLARENGRVSLDDPPDLGEDPRRLEEELIAQRATLPHAACRVAEYAPGGVEVGEKVHESSLADRR